MNIIQPKIRQFLGVLKNISKTASTLIDVLIPALSSAEQGPLLTHLKLTLGATGLFALAELN